MQLGPISTLGPITQKGPTDTDSCIFAEGSITEFKFILFWSIRA